MISIFPFIKIIIKNNIIIYDFFVFYINYFFVFSLNQLQY